MPLFEPIDCFIILLNSIFNVQCFFILLYDVFVQPQNGASWGWGGKWHVVIVVQIPKHS